MNIGTVTINPAGSTSDTFTADASGTAPSLTLAGQETMTLIGGTGTWHILWKGQMIYL